MCNLPLTLWEKFDLVGPPLNINICQKYFSRWYLYTQWYKTKRHGQQFQTFDFWTTLMHTDVITCRPTVMPRYLTSVQSKFLARSEGGELTGAFVSCYRRSEICQSTLRVWRHNEGGGDNEITSLKVSTSSNCQAD